MSNKAFVDELFNCSTSKRICTKSRETPWDFDQSNTNPVNLKSSIGTCWVLVGDAAWGDADSRSSPASRSDPTWHNDHHDLLLGRQSHQKIGEMEYDWWSIDMMIWWGDAVCWTWFVGRIVTNCGITKFNKLLEITLPASAVDRWPPARTDRNTSRGGCPVGSDATPSHRKMNWRLSPARNGIFGERWVGYGTILKRCRYAKNMHHWRLSIRAMFPMSLELDTIR